MGGWGGAAAGPSSAQQDPRTRVSTRQAGRIFPCRMLNDGGLRVRTRSQKRGEARASRSLEDRDAGAEPQGRAGGDAGRHLRVAGRGPGRPRAAAAHGAGPGGAAGAGGVGDGRLPGARGDAGGGPREARLPAGAHRPARGGAGAGEGAVPGGGPGARGGRRAGPAAGLLRHLAGGPQVWRCDGPGRVRPAGLPRAQRRGLAGVPRGADGPGRGRADVPAQRARADRADQGGARPHARKTQGPDRRHLVRRREGRLPGPGEAGRRRPKRCDGLD